MAVVADRSGILRRCAPRGPQRGRAPIAGSGFEPRRALPWLALALVVAGGALLLLPTAPVQPGAKLLADSGGKIRLAVLSVASARGSTLRNADLASRIVNRLAPGARLLLLAPDRAAFTVAANPWPGRVEFVDMPAGNRLTIWPQDPFLVLEGEHGPRLLASPDFARADDAEMAGAVAHHLDLPLQYSELRFEGGNIVSDDDFAFIGADTIRRNAVDLALDEREVAARFRRLLGKSVIVVGPTPQPVGHIDMVLTPLGGRRLVLADPGWGARLAELDLAEHPERVREFERRCERQFFGHPEITEISGADGEIIRPPAIVDTTHLAIRDSREVAPLLDRVANSLAGQGFEVSRVPFLFRIPEIDAPIKAGETIPSRPGYPMLTYNNLLIETGRGSRSVLLPQYGWTALDSAGVATWRSLGYAVEPIPGFAISAMYGGALRCTVKVLARDSIR